MARERKRRVKKHKGQKKHVPPGSWQAHECGPAVVGYAISAASYAAGEMVQSARSKRLAVLQLQRALNVLEGPTGAHWDATVGNPSGLTDGLIPDLTDPLMQSRVRGAMGAALIAQLARDEVARVLKKRPAPSIGELKRTARVVSRLLQAADEALGQKPLT